MTDNREKEATEAVRRAQEDLLGAQAEHKEALSAETEENGESFGRNGGEE
jgi:hypothetical protein